MSRTDKDMPHTVTAKWWTPWHDRCPNEPANAAIGSTHTPTRACDLPAEPSPKQYRGFIRGHCIWVPSWDRHHYPNPPHWFINHVWTAPQRMAARVECLTAAKEYRATGEVETTPTVDQNRHCAKWLWY